MSRNVLIGAVASTALLLSGCSPFEGAEHGMPEGHGEQHQQAHDAMHGQAETTPPIEGVPRTSITADAMAFEPATLELEVGEGYNLSLHSADVLHDLTIDEVDFHIVADAGEEVTGGVVFEEAGTYLAYCAVPGHRQAGMEMEITVR